MSKKKPGKPNKISYAILFIQTYHVFVEYKVLTSNGLVSPPPLFGRVPNKKMYMTVLWIKSKMFINWTLELLEI